MKKWLGILVVLLLLEVFYPARALEQTAAYDPTVLNGLSWDKMGLLEHVFFLAGYQSGVRFGSRQTPSDEPKHLIYDRLNARVPIPTATNRSVLQQVDAFYKDSRNAQICWADALEIAILSLNRAVFTEDELNVVRSADANDRCLGQSPGTLLSWDKSGLIEHVFFFAGYQSGVRFGSRQTPSDGAKFLIYDRLAVRVPNPTGANGSVLQQVDAFYKDSRNAQICWADAFEIARLSLKGAVFTEDELNVVRSADANDPCLGQSPGTPQAGAVVPSPKNATYPDSPEGLERYVEDLRSAFQSNERVVPDSKIETLRNRLMMPNHASRFTHVFGDQVGRNLETAYGQAMFSHMGTLAMFAAFGFDKSTYHAVRLEEVASARRTLEAIKKPTSAYAIVVNGGGLFGGYYFFYSEGGFYPIPLSVFIASDKASPGKAPQEVQLLSQVPPVYPPLARQARIQGDVVFHALIGKDGRVQSLNLISGHPLLVQAAMDAAKQWRYQPTLLNGEPVLVDTTITVTFSLGPG